MYFSATSTAACSGVAYWSACLARMGIRLSEIKSTNRLAPALFIRGMLLSASSRTFLGSPNLDTLNRSLALRLVGAGARMLSIIMSAAFSAELSGLVDIPIKRRT